MNPAIAKKLYLIGANRRNPSLWLEYDRLKESEWFSRECLENVQMERANEFISFATKYSPYYSSLFKKNNLSIADIDSIETLKKIPPVTKSELIENRASIHTEYTFNQAFMAETSGTSGSALEFRKNEKWDSINRANMMRAYDWYDVKPWDKHGYLWGYNISPKLAAKVKILDFLQNRFRTFSYEKESIQAFARKLNSATFIAGYSSMIYETARIINDIGVDKPQLKMIKGTSEMILDVYQDEVINAFGNKMVSEYGAAEAGLIAFECPLGNMHINIEDVIVEVGEDDEIIVTNLASYSFPVIRYKLGDAIKLSVEPCQCGRAHPVIAEVIGRKGAIVVGKRRSYPALTFYYVFKNLAMQKSILLNYKAIQQESGYVDLYIEGAGNSRQESLLVDELTKYFGDDIAFNLRYVQGFDREKKKTQYFESRL